MPCHKMDKMSIGTVFFPLTYVGGSFCPIMRCFLKKIRIHDLRHSHVSLLIDMGFTALAIADRVGHESIDITYRYAHLFPSRQTEMADKLNMERKGE